MTNLREYTHDPISLSILTRYLLSYLPDLNILYVASCTQHEISSSSDACIDTFSKFQELYIYVYMGIYSTLYIVGVVFLCSLSPNFFLLIIFLNSYTVKILIRFETFSISICISL